MFNKETPTKSSRTGEITFISSECQITGSLTINGDARIDGQVDGTINVTGELTVGSSAKVKASIDAKNISIAGEVRGDIKAIDTLELAGSARLYGDITTKQLKIDQGARFVGTSKLLEENSSGASSDSSLTKLRNEKKKVNEK